VDDFATTFGITNRTLLECLVFCLLDDHSSEALKVPALCLFSLDI
jgi:E3 ubiquitin-protein ligase HOS1